MRLTEVRLSGYRSIRDIRFPVRQLSVLVGENGVGKTNLYRSLELLRAAANGTLAEEIAQEGGLESVSWAGGSKKSDMARLVFEAALDAADHGLPGNMRYAAEVGFPMRYQNADGRITVVSAAFEAEAQVKEERLDIRKGSRKVALMERTGPSAWARSEEGHRQPVGDQFLPSETALSSLRGGYPELDIVRHYIASWRFYHSFRTDPGSPLRKPSLPVTSPMLASDGGNLAAVFATLRHIREDSHDLDQAIDDAFPGARMEVPMPMESATFTLTFPDFPRRPFSARELSDGTLQFLALMGALLSYRLPPFIALNEPETSLYPSLLPALARVIAKAAQRSQIWVVTHSRALADALAQETGTLPREVVRNADGATWLEGLSHIGEFDDD